MADIPNEKAISVMKRLHKGYLDLTDNRRIYKECFIVLDSIEASIRALGDERAKGEWIGVKTSCDIGHRFYYCTKCGREIDLIEGERLEDYPFCHCGADMRGKV